MPLLRNWRKKRVTKSNDKRVPALRFKGFIDDWEQRKFNKIANKIVATSSAKIPNVSYDDILSKVGVLNKKNSKLSTGKKGIKFEENDILFGKLRPYLKNYLLADFSGIAIGDFWVLRPLESPDFLFYLIQSQKFTYISNISSGSKMPRSDWNLVSNFHFNIPKINEQIGIGKVLKLLDKLLSLQQRKLEQLDLLKQAMLQQMFANKHLQPDLRFPNFSKNWKRRKLMTLLSSVIDFRGKTPQKIGLSWSTKGILALSALNVKDGYIDKKSDAHFGDLKLYHKWMNGKELHKGQVVFTTEAPMGKVAQIPDNLPYILSQRTIAFNVKKDMVTESFLATLLRTPNTQNRLHSLASGGTAKGVSQKTLNSLEIILPNTLKEQELIAKLYQLLNQIITFQQNKINKLQELKNSFLQNMFI